MKIAVSLIGIMAQPPAAECGEHAIGRIIPEAAEAITTLIEHGHEVIIHTCLANDPLGACIVDAWLRQHGVFGCTVWTEPGKPDADFYVDSKAIRLRPTRDPDEWLAALKIIEAAAGA